MTEKIVVPGEKISDKPLYLGSTYVKNEKTYAAVVGMMDTEGRYTPLEGVYTPKSEDTLVGIVVDSMSRGYLLDVNLPSKGVILSKETRLRLRTGDMVFGKVSTMSSFGDVLLSFPKKLTDGKIFKIPCAKIPRIIGKQSSMINMIRESSKTDIVVGNNGYIWVGLDGNIPLIKKVLDEIVANAHKKGLTDKMTKFIEENR